MFRHPIATGKWGRPRLVSAHGLLIGQVVTPDAERRVVRVSHRVVRGSAAAIAAVLAATDTGQGIDTADSERLNATIRSSLSGLVRRGWARAHTGAMLQAGMCLVGCADNLWWSHESLRLAAPEGTSYPGQERTPALADGLAGRRWTMLELLLDQVPVPAWVAPKRRGPPPKQAQPPALPVAA